MPLQAAVGRLSAGKCGYIHLPDMERLGFAEFDRHILVEGRKPGLVLDVRGNAGGCVSEQVLMRLATRIRGWDTGRYTTSVPIPSTAVCAAMVLLIDEDSGSDGDLIAHSFRAMGLGKLVGRRTWGGLYGTTESYTSIDGGGISVAGYAVTMLAADGSPTADKVENVGVSPDIDVEISPTHVRRGEDPQLEAAVAELLQTVSAADPAAREPKALGIWQVTDGDADAPGAAVAADVDGRRWPFALPAKEPDRGRDRDRGRGGKGGRW